MAELTLTTFCPIGDCTAEHTYTYDSELKNEPGSIKIVKQRITEMVDKTHKDGKHRLPGGA